MKILKPALNRRSSGNGHTRRVNGHTQAGRMAIAGTAPTQKNSVVGYSLRLVETAPKTFTVKIGRDRRQPELKTISPWLNPHLDCSIFPITRENTLVCTELFSKKEVAELERVTNVIPVSLEEAFSGICNSVRLPNQVLNSSHIHDLKAGTEDYRLEIQKNRKLEDLAANLGLEVACFNLGEFHKSGALLSCLVMHLNRSCYNIALTA